MSTKSRQPRPLPRLVADPEEEFTGTEIRDLTARATAAHTGASAGEFFTDIAYAAMSVLITAGLIAGLVNALRLGFAETTTTATIDPRWIQILATAAVLAGALGLAVRSGPLGVSRPGVAWWLPMPVDREGLLLPSWRRSVLVWPAATGAISALVGFASGVDAADIVSGALVGVTAGALIVAMAGLAQPSERRSAVLVTVADILVAVVPAGGLVLVVTSVGAPGAPGWWLAAVCAVLAVVAIVRWRPRLEDLPAAVLSARAGNLDRAQGALQSFDPRELGRSFGGASVSSRQRRSRRLGLVRGPVTGIVAADVTLLSRSPAALAQLVGLACLLLLALHVPLLTSGPMLFILMIVAGFRAAQLGAAGARIAEMAPVLDALLPMSARKSRIARCVLPAVCSAFVLVVGTFPLAGQWGTAWLPLVAVAGCVLGMATIRSAYRPAPDWSAPLIATPSGALPTGAASAIARGPDAALLGCVPLGVALVAGQASAAFVVAQLAVAAIVLAIVMRVPKVGTKSGFMAWMEQASEEAKERR